MRAYRHKYDLSRDETGETIPMFIAGTIRFVLEGVETELSRGDFCLVPQGRRFSYSNTGTALARLVAVHTPSFDLGAEVFAEPLG